MRFQSSEIPQANRLDLVLRLVDSAGPTGLTTAEIVQILVATTGTKYTGRQALYYGDAAVIIGLMVRNEDRYTLSRLGRKYALSKSTASKNGVLREALLENRLIYALSEQGFDENSQTEIAKWISNHSSLADSTARRRASTLSQYLKYI